MTNKELDVMEAEEEAQLWEEEQLTAWLQREDWTVEELIDSLEGHGILGITQEEEPYIGLLNALPEGGERYTLESELARRAWALLSRQPDAQPIGDPPERLLYNLLMLCAGLAHPDELAEPLLALWNRRALQGEWEGLGLRYALSTALTSNQIDARLSNEWCAMLHGRPTQLLEGIDLDGFEGLLWMPESSTKRGEPYMDAIGKALREMAAHLEDNPERRPQLRGLIQRVKETYPDRATWDYDLLALADKHHFPGWAVECLPRLFFVRKGAGKTRTILLWQPLADYFEGASRQKYRAEGRVVQLSASEEIPAWLYTMAEKVEERRNSFPCHSERGLRGAVFDYLGELEIRELAHAREKLRSVRKRAVDENIRRSPESRTNLFSPPQQSSGNFDKRAGVRALS
ncbi:MAG TPA: hypothetical protein VEW48_02015 [Thermoanaerobaculia bacterium]|nr:hypothetical protein [Thermoanaerobaculia bacterium]